MLQGQCYSSESHSAPVIFTAFRHTVVLCSTTERPPATSRQCLFALLHIFHPRVAAKQAPCCAERRHVCCYLIRMPRPFTLQGNGQAVMGYVVCCRARILDISFVYFPCPQLITGHFINSGRDKTRGEGLGVSTGSRAEASGAIFISKRPFST